MEESDAVMLESSAIDARSHSSRLPRVSARLRDSLRNTGLMGTIRMFWSYLRWRAAGSPQPTAPPTLEQWHEAYGALRPILTGDVTLSVICPVHNTPPGLLRQCVESVRSQSYPHWELVLVDDASTESSAQQEISRLASSDERIRLVRLEQNVGIAVATNEGAAAAEGEYLVFLDHDDVLAPTALEWLASCAGEADLIYSDEDKVFEDGTHEEAFFKPSWSPRLLLSVNYVNHLTCIRKELFASVGGLREGIDGVQDHDLLLRVSEQAVAVAHVPNVLYHWRSWSGSPQDSLHQRSTSRKSGFGSSPRPSSEGAGRLAQDWATALHSTIESCGSQSRSRRW